MFNLKAERSAAARLLMTVSWIAGVGTDGMNDVGAGLPQDVETPGDSCL